MNQVCKICVLNLSTFQNFKLKLIGPTNVIAKNGHLQKII